MKNLLEFILIHLVQHPDEVRIEEEADGRQVRYTLHVHPEDIGRVIGKGGSIINAIRAIGKIRAIKEGIYAQITIADGKDDDRAKTDDNQADSDQADEASDEQAKAPETQEDQPQTDPQDPQ